MPPPGYRSAASRSTPTQPLVEGLERREGGEESPLTRSTALAAGQQIGTAVSDPGDVSAASADTGSEPVARRLLTEDGHSPPDGPTDSPPDGDASAGPKSPAIASPSVVQRIGATDESPHDSEESRLAARLEDARVAREVAQKDARKKRQIESGGVVSWVKLSRLYNSQGFFSPRRSRFVRRHPAVDGFLRLVILAALLFTWTVGTIFAPGLSLGIAPGGPFPLPSSMWLVDALPLRAFRNPQVSGIAVMTVSALVFCALGFTLLHPRLATPMVSLFVSASAAQGLATFYDMANNPVDKVVTASIALALLLGAAGSAASQCSTQRLRAIFGGFWKPGSHHHHHPVVPPLTGFAVWLGIALGGLLGPALVSGSPRVTFDPSPWLGLLVMASGLGLLGAVSWHFFHPRLFVALLFGGFGLFGGGLVATQVGDDTADGRKFVGIGIAIMIMCCGAAVAKGRKLCCSCGGAHNEHENGRTGRRRDADEDFSSAILSGSTRQELSSASANKRRGDGLNTTRAGNTPSKRRAGRKNRTGDEIGSALARADLEFDKHGDDSDQDQATKARQRRRRIHFADEPTPAAAATGGANSGERSGNSALANFSPSPVKSSLAVRSPAGAGSMFELHSSSSRRRRGSTGGVASTDAGADLENQALVGGGEARDRGGVSSAAGGAHLSISPNAAFHNADAQAAAQPVDKDSTLNNALSGLRKMLHDRAQQRESPSPSSIQSPGISHDSLDDTESGAGVAAAAANFRHAMQKAAAEADAAPQP